MGDGEARRSHRVDAGRGGAARVAEEESGSERATMDGGAAVRDHDRPL